MPGDIVADFGAICRRSLTQSGLLSHRPRWLKGSLVHAIPVLQTGTFRRDRDGVLGVVGQTFICAICDKPQGIRSFPRLGGRDWNSTDWNIFSSECYDCMKLRQAKLKDHPLYSIALYNFCNRLLESLSVGAAARSYVVSLAAMDLVEMYINQNGHCALSGFKLELTAGKGGANRRKASVDRIDNKAAYCLGNVHFVCWGVNLMKQQLGLSEFQAWCDAVALTKARKEQDLLDSISS